MSEAQGATVGVSRKQRAALARALIRQAGTLVEFWDECAERDPDLAGIDAQTASEVFGQWCARLPGDAWSAFLVDPNTSA